MVQKSNENWLQQDKGKVDFAIEADVAQMYLEKYQANPEWHSCGFSSVQLQKVK